MDTGKKRHKKLAKVYSLPYTIPKTKCVVSAMTPSTAKAAIQVLAKSWAGGEPISCWFKVTESTLVAYFTEMQRTRAGPEPWMSICITDPKGVILGSSLIMELKSFPTSMENETDQLMTELYAKYKEKVGKEALEKREGKMVELCAMGLVDAAKGSGIAKHLLLGPLVTAAAQGYEWCVGQTTHDLSASVCEKVGMKWVASIKYDDFVYKAKDGTTKKVLEGIDARFTAELNKTRPKDKQLTTSASQFSVYEGNIKEMLAASHLY